MKNTNTKATTVTNTPENKADFLLLINNFNELANSPTAEKDFAKALNELSFVCACCVLKKVITAIENPKTKKPENETLKKANINTAKVLRNVRAEMIQAYNHLKGVEYGMNDAPEYKLTKNDEVKTIYHDPTKTLNEIIPENLGIGYDLVQSGIVEILNQIARQRQSGECIDLLREYTFLKLNKRIVIRNGKREFKQVTTTPIQEVFRAIREEIDSTKSARVIDNSYDYIQYSVKNPDSGKEEVYFERQEKMIDTSNEVTTAENYYKKYNEILAMCNTTQKTVLKLRCKGYGIKHIAILMNTQPRLVKRYRSQIAQKCFDIGFKPANMTTRPTAK